MPSFAISVPKVYRELVIVDGDTESDALAAARRGEGAVVGRAEFQRTVDPDVLPWICAEVP